MASAGPPPLWAAGSKDPRGVREFQNPQSLRTQFLPHCQLPFWFCRPWWGQEGAQWGGEQSGVGLLAYSLPPPFPSSDMASHAPSVLPGFLPHHLAPLPPSGDSLHGPFSAPALPSPSPNSPTPTPTPCLAGNSIFPSFPQGALMWGQNGCVGGNNYSTGKKFP